MWYLCGAAKAAAQGENISPDNKLGSTQRTWVGITAAVNSVLESVLTLMKLSDRELGLLILFVAFSNRQH